MSRSRRAARPAFTLLELVLSLAVMAVLMGALSSAVALASRAMPSASDPLSASLASFHAAEQMSGELFAARSFIERSEKAIEFTVADRNGDDAPESIRYEWSGTPGDPLTRSYNGTAPGVFMDDVYDFTLTYDVETQTETTTEEGTVWGEETLIAYFDGWPGVTADWVPEAIGTSNWGSQYFQVSPPADASALSFTHVELRLSRDASTSATFTVGIHPARTDGSYLPDLNAVIGSPVTISAGTLSTSVAWKKDISFSDAVLNDLTQSQFCLVLRGNDSLSAWYQYLNSRNAPDNGTVLRWTADGGGSWNPRSNQIHHNDMRFYLYGSYATSGEQTTTIDRYFLKGVRLRLRAGADAESSAETAIAILNAPQVSAP